eukprot:689531-Prymnesium_polylepis.1
MGRNGSELGLSVCQAGRTITMSQKGFEKTGPTSPFRLTHSRVKIISTHFDPPPPSLPAYPAINALRPSRSARPYM